MGPGRSLQLRECDRIDQGVRDIDFRDKPVEKGVGAFYDDIEGLDVVYCHVASGRHLRLRAFKVDSNEDAELIGHADATSKNGPRRCGPRLG